MGEDTKSTVIGIVITLVVVIVGVIIALNAQTWLEKKKAERALKKAAAAQKPAGA